MKTITFTAAILSAALFSSASFAGYDNENDILTGNGGVSASAGSPYIQVDSGPKGTETDLLSNLEKIKFSGNVSSFERVSNDRDNSEDLLNHVS